MQNNVCDSCGSAGVLHPMTRVKMKKSEMEVSYNDIDTNKIIKKMMPCETPIMRKVIKQSPFTGLMEETEEPELEYLQDRIIRVELALGYNERISREFCVKCFEKVKEEVKSTWKTLEGYNPL